MARVNKVVAHIDGSGLIRFGIVDAAAIEATPITANDKLLDVLRGLCERDARELYEALLPFATAKVLVAAACPDERRMGKISFTAGDIRHAAAAVAKALGRAA